MINIELGNALSTTVKAAFRKALKYSFSFLGTAQSKGVSGKSVLSTNELAIIRSTYELMKGNVKFAENCMMK